jgi:DNA mismatch repair protein PMS2
MNSSNHPTNNIRALSNQSIHRIVSSQVITDLSSVVKELVENSLDAQSSNVEVRLFDNGLTRIEVEDNGEGISPADFAHITAKSATSKLAEFTDIFSISSFGFRGEALNSLCATAKSLQITTRHQNEAMATELQFNQDGSIASERTVARNQGTTVIVSTIFHNLPVRLTALKQNIKKEYARLVNLLQSYACISAGVRFTVANYASNNKNNQMSRQLLFQTQGSSNMKDVIINIFGSKQAQAMMKIDLELHSNEEFQLPATMNNDKSKSSQYNLAGYYSRLEPGAARSSSDRQYLYINSRPVDLPKFDRLMNELYRNYNNNNSGQYPVYILNLTVPLNQLDINITPNKRTIILQNETELLAIIRAAFTKILQPAQATLPMIQSQEFLPDSTQNNGFDNHNGANYSQSSNIDRLSSDKNNPSHSYTSSNSSHISNGRNNLEKYYAPSEATADIPVKSTNIKEEKTETGHRISARLPSNLASVKVEAEQTEASPIVSAPSNITILSSENSTKSAEINAYQTKRRRESVEISQKSPQTSPHDNSSEGGEPVEDDSGVIRSKIYSPSHISYDFGSISSYFENSADAFSDCPALSMVESSQLSLQSQLFSENYLRIEFDKQNFARLEVIGQFNLGFIIAKLENQLFIIDQHATDEKFRYEKLKSSHEIQLQSLLRPLTLELTAADKIIVQEHLEVFENNGFRLKFNEEAGSVELVAIPNSKTYNFGPRDIEELVGLMKQEDCLANPGSLILPKIDVLLASRACRSAVMIGTALSGGEMKTIVSRMSCMQQAYNCPHGRPTMRHLFNLDYLSSGSSSSNAAK